MDLLHAANLRHGTDGFTSPPKEGVLRILSPLKIRRLRPGLNPRTWVLKANTLTSRPPKPSWVHTEDTQTLGATEQNLVVRRKYIPYVAMYWTANFKAGECPQTPPPPENREGYERT